jgi:flagellin-like protein
MFKKMWTDKQAVSPVIATILMVAITVVLAGVLVVYMQQFSTKPGISYPTASAIPTPFANPAEVIRTNNGGGWSVRIATISNPASWGAVTVQIVKDDLPVAKLSNIKSGIASTLWQGNGSGIPKWYALSGGIKPLKISPNGGPAVTPAPGSNGAGVNASDLQTMEGAYFIVVDADGSNSMSGGDLVLVFANYSGGTNAQIGGAGYKLEFAMTGTTICSTSLA